MKFHHLHIENLNSLYGKHDLDFDRQIGAAPVFLIVGPTGSGKSTILDAISLALFGETPRLDRRTGKPDRDVGHIMSLGTARSLVVLKFSMRESDGSRLFYRATWSMRRAREDAEGKIQRPERSLHRIDAGASVLLVSDHRGKFYEPVFSEVLRGIGVDDFKRSVVLAQGEFAAFLTAEDSEKASILERVTNTEQYRLIGSRAAVRRREWEQKYRLKAERLGEATEYSPLDIEELRKQTTDCKTAVVTAEQELAESRRVRGWVEKSDRLLRELAEQDEALKVVAERFRASEDDFKRLEADRIIRPAAEAIQRLRVLEKHLGSVAEEERHAQSEFERSNEAAQRAELKHQTCQAHLVALRKSSEELAPKLVAAERLMARVLATGKSLESAQQVLGRLESQRQGFERRKMALDERIVSLEFEAQGLVEMLAGGESRGGFEALETLFSEALRPAIVEEGRRERRVLELVAELEASKGTLDKLEVEAAKLTKTRAPLLGLVTRHNRSLAKVAGDRPEQKRVDVFKRVQAASRRRDALLEAARLTKTITTLEESRKDVHESLARIQDEIRELEAVEKTTKQEEANVLALVHSAETQTALVQRQSLLSELRSELVPGTPCALCGSPLHPFCESDELKEQDDSTTLDARRMQEMLEELRERLRASNFRVQQLRAQYVSRTTSLRHEEGRQVSVSESLEQALKDFSVAAEASGFSPLDSYRLRKASVLEGELAEAAQDLADSEARLKSLDKLISQLENAEKALGEFDEKHLPDGVALADAKARCVNVQEQLNSAQAEHSAAVQALRSRAADFGTSLGVWGIEADVDLLLENPDRFLQEAREGSAELSRLDAHSKTLKLTLVELVASAAALQEQIADGQAELERQSEVVAQLDATRVAEDSELTLLLEGKPLEEWRRDEALRMEEARRALEKSAELANAARLKSSRIQASLDELKKSATRLSAERSDWELTLAEVIKELGVEETFARSVVLEEKERQHIERTQSALQERRSLVTQRRNQVSAALEEHQIDMPPATTTLEGANEAVKALEAKLNIASQALGAASASLSGAEGAQARQSSLREELSALEGELEKWSIVAGLIGVGDGASFKLFAQTLNLRGLVERANQRLESLHPRYRLDVPENVDRPTLSFLIRDRYRANAARPLSTMSGGETFLVSLALALALSDYRRIDFPVETLLLDEGFGTLDQESLQMALNTLHRLHQDGSRQIGIISHVEALRDMVDTRIIVEGTGHGRSVLRVEHGSGPPNGSV